MLAFSSFLSKVRTKRFVPVAGIFEPMELLAASRNKMAVSLLYLPLELSESRFVSLVRCADAMAEALGNSASKA